MRGSICYSAGQFEQRSLTGRYLRAHELAHVAQQTGLSPKHTGAAAENPFHFSGNTASSNLPISRMPQGETIQ